MVVIESGSGGIDSLMRELAKDGHPPTSKASIAAMPTVTVVESNREFTGLARFAGSRCRPADEEEEPEKKNEPGISVSIFIRATSEDSDRTGDLHDSIPSEAAVDDDGDHMQS
ncbi:uncharacterized protein LOC133711951 [Rosa rugosa]|uniref:uncharacterized protein LOC133711951 n=1 Tax=Rosa rugosa TaxID=74645 RepID=UPI002B4146F2|nr:uncharacterized protein LOC133711951 [Rosa rugosa]